MKKIFLIAAVALLIDALTITSVSAQPPVDDPSMQVAEDQKVMPKPNREKAKEVRGKMKENHATALCILI